MAIDWKKEPPLYSVILVNFILSCYGVITSVLYLNTTFEKTLLSSAYVLLFVAASCNQGNLYRNTTTFAVDHFAAFAIFLLNIYYWGRSFTPGVVVYGALLFLYYFVTSWGIYDRLSSTQYAIHVNIWHLGIVLLIWLVPVQLEQNNLF